MRGLMLLLAIVFVTQTSLIQTAEASGDWIDLVCSAQSSELEHVMHDFTVSISDSDAFLESAETGRIKLEDVAPAGVGANGEIEWLFPIEMFSTAERAVVIRVTSQDESIDKGNWELQENGAGGSISIPYLCRAI